MATLKEKKKIATERFEIGAVLGTGGSGTVYEAYDRERKHKVALKTLKNVDPVEIYRFKNEFRVLADFAHRNLVKLYDLLYDGAHWFFTMERVEGKSFVDYVRLSPDAPLVPTAVTLPAPWVATEVSVAKAEAETEILKPARAHGGPSNLAPSGPKLDYAVCDMVKLCDALPQLAEGLEALHRAGKLHCDIKPSNVLITDEGRVVILDLGIARDLEEKNLYTSMHENVSGTPAYMSPEQARGVTLGPASDWYGVGAMLHEALTGFLPFRGSMMRVIHDKQKLDPRPPSEIVPGIPARLDQLCHRLLQRDPCARPDGRTLLKALGRTCGKGKQNLMSSDSTFKDHFVPRPQLMYQLADAFRQVRAGRTSVCLVHGASGMGKSRLVDRFLKGLRGEHDRLILLKGRCYQRESVPYKALDCLVDQLSAYLKKIPAKEARALMPDDVLGLTRLFPVLGRVQAVAGARRDVLRIPDSREQRRRAFAAWRALFHNLGRRGDLVLYIDDLHWGDRDSAFLLNELLRPPHPPRLLLIGTYAGEAAASSPLLTHLAQPDTLGDHTRVKQVVVGELNRIEATELAHRLLGEDDPEAARLAPTIAQESGGCPFLIEAMVRFARTLADEDGETAGKLAPCLRQATVEKVVAYQLDRLGKDAQRLITLLALAGRPVDPKPLASVAEIERPRETLSALQQHKLIRIRHGRGGDVVECYHNRVREAILAGINSGEAREAHLLLARAMETIAVSAPEAVAEHFRDAGDQSRAAELTVQAAQRAEEALAFDRAAQLYRVALDLDHLTDAVRFQIKMADALANAGRGHESGEAYLEAAKGSGVGRALELRRRAAEQFLISGHMDRGKETADGVLATIGMNRPATAKRALLSLLRRRTHLKMRGLNFKEKEASLQDPQEVIKIDTCWSMAVGLGMVDTIRGMDFSTRHLLLALDSGEPYRISRALSIEAAYSATAGSKGKKRTDSLLQTAGELVERVENPHAQGLYRMIGGAAAFLQGRWRTAAERCTRAEDILRRRCTGVTWEVDTAVQFLMRAYVYLGDWKHLAERYQALLKDNRERGDLYAEINLMTCVAPWANLIEDRPQQALNDLDYAVGRWTQKGFHLQHYWHLTGRAAVAMYNNNGRAFWDKMQGPFEMLENSMLLRIQFTRTEARHVRARCALAALAQEPVGSKQARELEKIVRTEIQTIRKENLDWANPLANLLEAGLSASLGDTDDALKLLARAVPAFENGDMTLFRAAALRRRGQLMGQAGAHHVAAADQIMREQGIRRPEKMVNVLAPGNWQTAKPPIRRRALQSAMALA